MWSCERNGFDSLRSPHNYYFVQDIVKSCYKHPDDLTKDAYTFCGKGFCLWIGNRYRYFRLYSPKEIEFNPDEKIYLWNIYKNWVPNVEIEY